jgi:hypothetical protein
MESPWPLRSKLNVPLPAGTLDGEIEIRDGGALEAELL